MFIFSLLAGLISIYTMLCFIRIALTWFPSMTYNKFTLFLSRICDPYLNIFRRIQFLRLGYVDFSPAVAVALLVAVSSLVSNIALQQRIYVGGIVASLVSVVWSIASSLIGFLTILLAVRLIALLLSKGSVSPIWQALDSVLNPVIYRVAGMFSSGNKHFIPQQKALIISIVVLILCQVAGGILISIITGLLEKLPF
ncbi:MAG: YggT family protein [Spirochaetaceae bacterium]|nr:YggT family protein [Spirochaetaceae bacterium]